MTENGSEEGSLVMAEPLGLAEEVCRRMVDVVRVVDGAPPRRRPRGGDRGRSGAINTVLVKKGARVSELRQLRHPLQTGCRPAAQQRSSL